MTCQITRFFAFGVFVLAREKLVYTGIEVRIFAAYCLHARAALFNCQRWRSARGWLRQGLGQHANQPRALAGR